MIVETHEHVELIGSVLHGDGPARFRCSDCGQSWRVGTGEGPALPCEMDRETLATRWILEISRAWATWCDGDEPMDDPIGTIGDLIADATDLVVGWESSDEIRYRALVGELGASLRSLG